MSDARREAGPLGVDAGRAFVASEYVPGEPLDRDLYRAPAKDLAHLTQAPQTLQEALDALEKDHAFLLKGDVFNRDIIETWIQYKTDKEVNPIRMRPSPLEFALYFDT